ncbi:MAG TPA: CAP domain-containing protein [Candidatus Paceibacterota bacterium]|nr:CAP domain-containing protein [Candidatus Paceibacterota bacterium]
MARRKRRGIDLGDFGWSPRFLKEEVYVATFVLVVCLFAGAGMLDRYIKEAESPYIAAVIAAVLTELANEDRQQEGLRALQTNPKLVAAAQRKADDMAAKGYFAHETPEGHNSWHWFREVGYDYAYAGENLAVNFSESADVEKAWMASPTHRENILNARYTEIGIATAVGTYKGKPAIFAVQMFGHPSEAELRSRESAPGDVPARAPASATATSVGATLGEATETEEVQPIGALAEEDGDAAVIAESDIPWWAYLAAQPKQTLRYAYYVLGLLILAALFFDMELELKWHHFRHARKAGYLLATMSMLFIAADWLFFAEPTLAVLGILAH